MALHANAGRAEASRAAGHWHYRGDGLHVHPPLRFEQSYHIQDYMGNVIILLGIMIFVVGGFLFLVAAFRESILWGLACLFLPIIPLFFLIVHWHAAKKPFFIQLAGFAVVVVGAVLSPQTFRG